MASAPLPQPPQEQTGILDMLMKLFSGQSPEATPEPSTAYYVDPVTGQKVYVTASDPKRKAVAEEARRFVLKMLMDKGIDRGLPTGQIK